MGFGETDAAVAVRFASYIEGLADVLGHKDRVQPLRDYCVGQMMPCERKSVEPMAAAACRVARSIAAQPGPSAAPAWETRYRRCARVGPGTKSINRSRSRIR